METEKKMAVFWVAGPCRLAELYQRFRGTCCLHHQGDETTQKRALFFFTAVRTAKPTYVKRNVCLYYITI
jgi:hypothetical protein